MLQQFIERGDLRQLIDPGYHTLMTMASTHFGQPKAVRFNQPNAGLAGTVGELTHPRIAPRHIKKHLQYRLRGGLDAHAHGMKTEKNFRCTSGCSWGRWGHGKIIPG